MFGTATLTILNGKLQLWTSNTEDLFARHVRGGRRKPSFWEHDFSLEKVNDIKRVFSEVLIDEAVKKKVKEEHVHRIKLLHIKKIKDCNIDVPLKTKPYLFQKVGIKYMLEALEENCSKGVLCVDEMGLGKSFQSLAVAQILKRRNKISFCLIICPASVKGSWKYEIEKHVGETPLMVEGDLQKRLGIYEIFKKRQDFFLVVNYALLRQDLKYFLDFWPNGSLIIADETIKIKNPKAKQTKATKALLGKYKIALTGYPIANIVSDLWSQVDFIKPNWMSRWAFEDKFLIKTLMPFRSPRGKEIKIITGTKNLNLLKEIIEPMHIRRLKSEVLPDLPPKVFETRETEMKSEQLRAYVQMRDELRTEIKSMTEETIIVNAPTILSKFIRLSQLANGYLSSSSDVKPYWFKKNAKFELLDELLEEIISSGNSAVIWSRFVPVVKTLLKRYGKKYNATGLWGGTASEERTERIKRFQEDPTCRIFVGEILAGGLGITLTKGNIVILFDQCFLSAATINQGIDRCHRISQEKKVVVISLQVKNSIDEHWQKVWLRKEKTASEIFKGDEIKFRKKEDYLDLLK